MNSEGETEALSLVGVMDRRGDEDRARASDCFCFSFCCSLDRLSSSLSYPRYESSIPPLMILMFRAVGMQSMVGSVVQSEQVERSSKSLESPTIDGMDGSSVVLSSCSSESMKGMGYRGWLRVLLMLIALNLLIGEELLLVVLRRMVLLSALEMV